MCGKVFTFYLFLVCFCQCFASNSCVSHILSAFCGRSQLRSYPKTVGCCKNTNTFIWNLTLKFGSSILLASIVEPFSTLLEEFSIWKLLLLFSVVLLFDHFIWQIVLWWWTAFVVHLNTYVMQITIYKHRNSRKTHYDPLLLCPLFSQFTFNQVICFNKLPWENATYIHV